MINYHPNQRIIVKNVSKQFRARVGSSGMLAMFISLIYKKERIKNPFVLNNVSLDVSSGEKLGIIGRNGSGKSTLLKMIAGIYSCDMGHISTRGKLVYLSGFGHGLQERLSMRENIYLVASIMGLHKSEIEKIFDTIVDFSGLRDHLDAKIYQFSSGMLGRLSFSIAIHCINHHNPDILLLDEVFGAGGDIDFSRKASEKIEEFVKGGSTVIIVSHDLEIISKYCNRVLWLEKGQVRECGKIQEIIERYKNG